jgi:hypothetical protein
MGGDGKVNRVIGAHPHAPRPGSHTLTGLPERESLIEQIETAATPYLPMPRGDKSSYSSKQKRQAEHIEEGYEKRGVAKKTAEARAWATVNKMTGGGKKSGSGRGKKVNKAPARKGGRKGGKAAAASKRSKRGGSRKRT